MSSCIMISSGSSSSLSSAVRSYVQMGLPAASACTLLLGVGRRRAVPSCKSSLDAEGVIAGEQLEEGAGECNDVVDAVALSTSCTSAWPEAERHNAAGGSSDGASMGYC